MDNPAEQCSHLGLEARPPIASWHSKIAIVGGSELKLRYPTGNQEIKR